LRKAEFYRQAEKYTDKHGDLILSVYKALQYRWEETADPQTDDEAYFFTELEAKEYLETINLNIGFQAQIEQIEFEYTDFNTSFDFGSEGDIEDFIPNFDNCNAFYYGDVFEGEDITGAIVVQWSYEKHVGYCRNLQDIGIAGEYPFHELKTEKDLITGNEESTFRINFSVLLTKDEVEDASNIKEAVEEELQNGHWKWNYFRNNPNSYHIAERLDELFGKTVTIEEEFEKFLEQYCENIEDNGCTFIEVLDDRVEICFSENMNTRFSIYFNTVNKAMFDNGTMNFDVVDTSI
jgi:hypothetical protein